ncbi:MAG TPA: FAD-dependent oxidoreductase, partial [Opitutales bacterium]|nr:FAD-dependent oxidoreductase [Opitutales bacterium]
EGGLVDELLVENTFRNPEGNPLIWDTILLEKVLSEANIRLLLNTAVDTVRKSGPDRIESVSAYCSQSQVRTILSAPLFCDCSGDGIVGFQAGAAFRMGAEKSEEFGEGFAPDASYGELLGHTIYFYSKDTGKPVTYVPPAFALKDIRKIPRFKQIQADHTGCNFWWIEYGGRRDTIHETEAIKYELWSVVYGVWDYIKNSGEFPEAENLTLEWVGTIPGKRESRRFEGDYMLKQKDVVEQVAHPDAVSTGGWSLDLHPSDGLYTDKPGCNQYHSKGVYGIPYRCYYSRNISNLFLAGRIISASHVAFGSSRVILTCGHGGSAVGMAAVHCLREKVMPRELNEPERMRALQDALNAVGQAIPQIPASQADNLAADAEISASSTMELEDIPGGDEWKNLEYPVAQLIPWEKDYRPKLTFQVRSKRPASLRVALRRADKSFNFTPEVTLEEHAIDLREGEQTCRVELGKSVSEAAYGFLSFYGDDSIEIRTSDLRCTGLMSVRQKGNKKVAPGGEQVPPEGIGIDRFEFWTPERRPGGKNLALQFDPPLDKFSSVGYLLNGFERPRIRSNAWIADPGDPSPTLTMKWPEPRTIESVELYFDTDFDHAMETAQWGHPEAVMPTCVRDFTIVSGEGKILAEVSGNYQTRRSITFGAVTTKNLVLKLKHPSRNAPAAIFGLSVK